MSLKSKFTLIVLSATLAVYTIAGAWLATRAQQPANDPGGSTELFESVLQLSRAIMLMSQTWKRFAAGALRGLAYGLDPTRHTSPEQ